MVVNNLPIWAQKCSTSIICVTLTCESFFPPSGSFLISFRGRGKTLFAEDPTTLSSLLGFEASPHIERVPLPLPLPRPVMLLTVNLSNHDLQLLALYKPLIFSAQFSITFNRSKVKVMFQAFLLHCSHEAPLFVSRALAVKRHPGLAIQRRRGTTKTCKKDKQRNW